MNLLHIFEKCHISSVLVITLSFFICVLLITDDALMESESRTAADKTDVPAVPSPVCQPQQNLPIVAMTASIPQGSDSKLYPELLLVTWGGYFSLGICTSECMK